jgi:diadenosine tetraphosphate (Ap4A) HIT family hydrolase
MSTIFDKILDGEIPCHRLYEDEQALVAKVTAALDAAS